MPAVFPDERLFKAGSDAVQEALLRRSLCVGHDHDGPDGLVGVGKVHGLPPLLCGKEVGHDVVHLAGGAGGHDAVPVVHVDDQFRVAPEGEAVHQLQVKAHQLVVLIEGIGLCGAGGADPDGEVRILRHGDFRHRIVVLRLPAAVHVIQGAVGLDRGDEAVDELRRIGKLRHRADAHRHVTARSHDAVRMEGHIAALGLHAALIGRQVHGICVRLAGGDGQQAVSGTVHIDDLGVWIGAAGVAFGGRPHLGGDHGVRCVQIDGLAAVSAGAAAGTAAGSCHQAHCAQQTDDGTFFPGPVCSHAVHSSPDLQ